MKTKKELNTLKDAFETLNKKHTELTEDELEQVAGGKEWLNGMTAQSSPFSGDFLNNDAK